ncbi:hypothetical protein V8E36_007660 [Tilletia maclaganii]
MVPPTTMPAVGAAAPAAAAPATGGHTHTISTASSATVKDAPPVSRRIIGSGSNTELRAQIRRERRQQQQQGNLAGSTASMAGSGAGAEHRLPSSHPPTRPGSSQSSRPPSNLANTAAAAPQQHAGTSRRTASASSVVPSQPSSSLNHQSNAPATMSRASSHQQLLHPNIVYSSRAHDNPQQHDRDRDWTVFSTVSQVSTHGHGTASHQGHTQALTPAQTGELPQHAWPKELEPAVHTSVIDAIIANFQTKYAEAALKCKDWQAYAAKLKTQSRALSEENRLLRQLTERHQEQIRINKIQLDTAVDERERSEMERARLEGRVEELESLLLSQGHTHFRGHHHGYERASNPSVHARAQTAPGHSQTRAQADADGTHPRYRHGPAQLQVGRSGNYQTGRDQQHSGYQNSTHLLAATGGHSRGLRSVSRSGDPDPSELYQTAIDAATAALETGLDLSVPSAPRWDDPDYGDEQVPTRLRDLEYTPGALERPDRVLRRSGNLHGSGSRTRSGGRSGSRQRHPQSNVAPDLVTTTDDDEDSSESESESETESEYAHRNSLARASMLALASMDRPDGGLFGPEIVGPPTPTGYQQSQRESSGYHSFPSPENMYQTKAGAGVGGPNAGGSPDQPVPMHMHSSPPYPLLLTGSDRVSQNRSQAHPQHASLLGRVHEAEQMLARRGDQAPRIPVHDDFSPVRVHRDDELLVSAPPSLISPAPPAQLTLPDIAVEHHRTDDGGGRGTGGGRDSPADILDQDAQRREEIGPSPLVGYSMLHSEYDNFELDIATGSPMGPTTQHGLGLRLGNCTLGGDLGSFQPLRLDSASVPPAPGPGPAPSQSLLPASDSHRTLVEDDSAVKATSIGPGISNSRSSASLRSNGAQRYTVISPVRGKVSASSSSGPPATLSFSALAAPAEARSSTVGRGTSEQPKRPNAPPVTALGSASGTGSTQGHGVVARKRSSNSTDAELARTSASIPTLPFMPTSKSAPAGLLDVTNVQKNDSLAPVQTSSGRPRGPSTLSEATTVKDRNDSAHPAQSQQHDEVTRALGTNLPGSHAETQNRPTSLTLPTSQREASQRFGSQGPAGPMPPNSAGPQAQTRPLSRPASRNSNRSLTTFQMIPSTTSVAASTSMNAINLNRTSAGTLSVNSIGGEHLIRARNRSRASSHSVHDAIPVVVKDDVFSDAGHGGPGSVSAAPSPLFGAANTSTSSSGAGDPPRVLARGSSTSTIASTQQSLSPDVKLATSASYGAASVVDRRAQDQGRYNQAHEEVDTRQPVRVSSHGLAALSPSISRAGRPLPDGQRAQGANASFSRTPMSAAGLHVREDTIDDRAEDRHQQDRHRIHADDGHYGPGAQGQEPYGDDGEADGVGPHRHLYARLRSTLEPSHLAKFEKYVHRYDALDIPLEGPRGLINRVRKLLLRGEPDLEQRPDRLRLMKDLLREFEALVRVELPAPG